jgi:hypothetical protein
MLPIHSNVLKYENTVLNFYPANFQSFELIMIYNIYHKIRKKVIQVITDSYDYEASNKGLNCCSKTSLQQIAQPLFFLTTITHVCITSHISSFPLASPSVEMVALCTLLIWTRMVDKKQMAIRDNSNEYFLFP